MARTLLTLIFLAALAPIVFAHEVRPAYLELRQTGAETYDALWKVPGQGDLRFGLYVELPVGCTNVSEIQGSMGNGSFTERWTVMCPNGLSGGTIHIAGLSRQWPTCSCVSRDLTAEPKCAAHPVLTLICGCGCCKCGGRRPNLHLARHRTYLVGHRPSAICPRVDYHYSRRVEAGQDCHRVHRFAQHHATLATLGYVHIPQRPVEATIALSIVFVAAEILRGRKGQVGITARAPWSWLSCSD